jgi:hypothetical protein
LQSGEGTVLKLLIQFVKDEHANIENDWVVLLAGAVSISIALAISFSQNTGTQPTMLANATTIILR